MFSDVAMGIPKAEFDKILNKQKEKRNIESDIDLNTDDLKEIVKEYKAIYKKYIGEDFPQDPKVQLFNAVRAVFMSWNTPRAKTYRKLNEISDVSLVVSQVDKKKGQRKKTFTSSCKGRSH